MSGSKYLLVIGHVWPEPSSSAAGSRMMQLLQFFLNRGFQISFGSVTGKSPHAANLEALGIKSLSLKLNDSSFDELLLKLQPDMVMFDRFMTEEQFGWRVTAHAPAALRILDTEDLHFLRKARQAVLDKENMPSPDLFHTETAKREVASIYRCDISLIISRTELFLLQKSFKVPDNLLFYLPFMIDSDLETNTPGYTQRQHFVSIGNFKHPPNWDAVLQLKQNIWPLIRRKLPMAELHIYGAYPGSKVFALHDPGKGFLIKGRADSAVEMMKAYRVLLAPLRFGAGLKGKFVDAMQAGTPNITTEVGAEGMEGKTAWNGAIQNEPEIFAEAAVELYTDASKWKAAQERGFCLLREKFSRKDHQDRFEGILNYLLGRLQSHRASNFTGKMLNHHSMASTKYLAKYIEAKKNKTQ